jgi:hypothetical protein
MMEPVLRGTIFAWIVALLVASRKSFLPKKTFARPARSE